MRFLPLLLANLLRKKIRTTLTLGSFAIALFLFGLLVTIRGAFNQGIDVAGADRLFVINKVSLIQPLPLAYRDRILKIPGVAALTYAYWFGGVYKDEKNFFVQFAIDRETYLTIYPEFLISAEEWQAFLDDKQAAIAGESTVRRFGWKVGDRIPIKGSIYPGTWEFNLRGIYRGLRPQDDTTQFWFRSDYLDERTPAPWRGYVGWYVVKIKNPDDAVQVARAIDERFANSPWETRAETERAFAASFVKQMGNIEFLMLSIGAVVFFTLLLVTGNTMAIAVRERTGELAVLKAVGYSDAFVLLLVLAESVFLAVTGGAIGLALAKVFTLGGDPTGAGILSVFYLSPVALAVGLVVALGVGIAAGLLPALSAMRLSVVAALRRV